MVSFTTGVVLILLSIISKHITAYAPLQGVKVTSVASGQNVDLGEYLSSPADKKAMLVLGTYAADFNAIEYAQRLRYYVPKLRECGVSKFGLVLNCKSEAAKTLAEAVDLDTEAVELLVDPSGEAGRAFGVERGWRPDDKEMSPFLKLFGMLWGLGAWAKLPAVIGGYIGNPFYGQPWIEDALAVGQTKGRWPGNSLEIANDGTITNKFSELPVVGEWKRPPLELATLRLQNMLGISLSKWKELAPDDEALKAGVLTQLGACIVVDSSSGKELYKWRDPGICAVANYEDILKELRQSGSESSVVAEPGMDEHAAEKPPAPVESVAINVSIPYDAAALLAYAESDKSMEYDAFKAKFEADAVADVIAKRSPKEMGAVTDQSNNADAVDISIPYDAAARLAYEATDKSVSYEDFKVKFECDAVADVMAKRSPKETAVVASEESSDADAVDLSIPYDAAARLAYDYTDKSVSYEDFKVKYESDAVADVVAKSKART